MTTHLGVLLEAVAVDPGVRLSRLPVLTSRERERVVSGWNQAVAPVPAEGVVGRVLRWSVESPDAVAMVADGACMTYGGLVARAAQLAGYLRGLGVGAESVVGVCVERGAEMVVAVLGAWLADAAYLPLDPGYPAERLKFMVADAGAEVVLGHRAVADAVSGVVAGGAAQSVWLDDPEVAAEIGRGGAGIPAGGVNGDGLAAVIYTSGSTGRPKGALVTHGSLAGVFGGWEVAHFGGERLRWLSVASMSFDVFTGDVVRALGSGGVLVLGDPGVVLSVRDWAGLLAAERVGALECAPRYADQLADLVGEAGVRLPGLRLLVVTTDVWRVSGVARARAALGDGVRILTAYGVTEATI
ncbi:AMP-binding protein, partial [Actinomadura nitritigenes]|uniref:AMP-binding protein n=1 Tax=Actinomadura nitritigenes TaxID=134602 RepID=UPI003676F322